MNMLMQVSEHLFSCCLLSEHFLLFIKLNIVDNGRIFPLVVYFRNTLFASIYNIV
jgi:hypothetical protein